MKHLELVRDTGEKNARLTARRDHSAGAPHMHMNEQRRVPNMLVFKGRRGLSDVWENAR